MSYSRDSSKDLVWDENSNSYVSESAEPTTIAEAIAAAQQRVAAVYTAISNKGGTLPATQNLSNLPTAIDSIPSGGGQTITDSRNYLVLSCGAQSPICYYQVSAGGSANRGLIMTNNLLDTETMVQCSYCDLETDRALCCYVSDWTASSFQVAGFQSAIFGYITGWQEATSFTPAMPIISRDQDAGLEIKEIHLNSVTGTIKAVGKGKMFPVSLTTIEKIEFANATEIDLRSTFNGYTGLKEILMPKAENITLTRASATTGGPFKNSQITKLEFPSLKSTSTISMSNMLEGVTDCTVHFPSNLQSVIGQSADVLAGFGGTNTTVLFDLPATS